VWTYLLRRLLLMIPTLFGVTIVTFIVMQTAPGDPQLNQLGMGGTTGQSTETRDAYLLRKRDLKLDKPLILNFNYFRNYAPKVRMAAWFMGRSEEQIAGELPELARAAELTAAEATATVPEAADRLEYLRSLGIDSFDSRLADLAQHERLAKAVLHYVQVFCEDNGVYGVPAAVELLRADDTPLELKIGAIRCLKPMVVEPFQYTYSTPPSEGQTADVCAVWQRWWNLSKSKFPPLDPDRRKALAGLFAKLTAETSRAKRFEMIERFDREDAPFFVEKLLGDSTLDEKSMAAATLKLFAAQPLQLEVPTGAGADAVREVGDNWLLHYAFHQGEYDPSLIARTWDIVADTQYAHMVWRLVTFRFGRSAIKTREPVKEKIWSAVIVSAPLMLMAELVIYLVAVPLGILCAVRRGRWTDRLISFQLFLLYSVPGFVAGMLFLLFFCYGDFLKWFPMLNLHSDGAEHFGLVRYVLDFLWHAFLPVTCLSLFSLAGMAMYSRSAMLDVIGQDYIRTARAKGLSEPVVIFKHGLRNALIPIITLFASFLPAMLGGSVLIEVLFGIPGMGRLSWESIEQKDFPTLMALVYIDAIVVMISILLSDMLYVVADPRISFEAQGKNA
jgi:peptide/nickel transport system permease protein